MTTPHLLLAASAETPFHWMAHIAAAFPVAHALLALSVVAAMGLSLGKVRIGGVGLGVAGVLFAGLVAGHFGFQMDPHVREFVRDFGLVLFVFTVGLQLGPGFFTSLRRDGLPLNIMAAAIVLLGAATALAFGHLANMDMAAVAGLFAGATTNTPALGAAQQAAKGLALADPSRVELPALAYAVSYPFGIVGIILSMALFRRIFRVDPAAEDRKFKEAERAGGGHLERLNILVENENLNGVPIRELPGKNELGILISRVRFAGEEEVQPARGETLIHVGDTILAVGPPAQLKSFQMITGRPSAEDLMSAKGRVTFRRLVVTSEDALDKSVAEIGFDSAFGVSVTRVTRAGIEIPATGWVRLKFGDVLQVVGREEDIARVAASVGNSTKALNQTNFVAVFIGIAAGVLLGLVPFHLPGLPVEVRLGIAGGPLLAAILLSRIGRVGPIVWHMPDNANLAVRELGIVLFLACVGLKAGDQFMEILLGGEGLKWLLGGVFITLLPLLVVGLIGRLVWKLNFMSLCGLLSGSMTDPPALAFATATAGSDSPAVAYASVYPLAMLLRIVVAQVMVVVFVH